MKTIFNALKSLIYGTLFFCLWIWIDLLIKNIDKSFGWSLPAGVYLPGLILIIIGFPIAIWPALSFVIYGQGTPAPFDAPKEFVAVGPYKYVRNPMYIGGFFLFVGFALVNYSLSMLLFPFIWFIIVHLFIIYYEEKKLEKRFGQSYIDYKKKTNRWIPKFKINK